MSRISSKDRLFALSNYCISSGNVGGFQYLLRLSLAWPDWADGCKIQVVYDERDARIASGENVVVDHIVPLRSRYVSGLHNEFNLRVIHVAENRKKSNNYWPDMWAEQLELEV